METTSLSTKPPQLDSELRTNVNISTEKRLNGPKLDKEINAPFKPEKNGMKRKKARVEDIIMNLKKGKMIRSPRNTNDILSMTGDCEDEKEHSSFASMCTIREDPPELSDSVELPPMKKTSEALRSKSVDKITLNCGSKVSSPKISPSVLTVSSSSASVKQVIYQTVPQNSLPHQQTPIILNKLPPGKIVIKNSIPSNNSTNLVKSSASSQPKLLLITKPIYIAQNVSVPGTQTHAKILDASTTVLSQARPGNVSGIASQTKFVNSNATVISNSSSKTSGELPLITVQYNLPYPNNNCKVVHNPVNIYRIQTSPSQAVQTSVSKAREMKVNFAGNQTAHITTFSDQSPVLSEKPSSFIPAFTFLSNPEGATVRNKGTISDGETRKLITSRVATVSSSKRLNGKTRSNKGLKAKKTFGPTVGRRFTYEQKIARLTGRTVGLDTFSKTAPSDSKESADSKLDTSSVRISNRKRQQTEKAKLFEKTKKKLKGGERNVEKKQKGEMRKKKKGKMEIIVKLEKDSNALSSKSNSGEKSPQSLNQSPTKKISDTSSDQQVSCEEEEGSGKKSRDDGGSLFRDPALLTREERALQRALMLFQQLEEKQSRRQSGGEQNEDVNRHNLRKSVKKKQHESKVLLRKRKNLNEENDENLVKKCRQEVASHSFESSSSEIPAVEKLEDTKSVEGNGVINENKTNKVEIALEKSPSSGSEGRKKKVKHKNVEVKKADSADVKETKDTNVLSSNKEVKPQKASTKDVANVSKPSVKTSDSVAEKHRVKTYMLVPSYHGFKDFSPTVLGSRTRSKKSEPVKPEKEDEVSTAATSEEQDQEIPLLVVETVGNKAVKQDVVAKDEQLRDLVKSSLRAQGMLKQELETKKEDEEHFENREKRHVQVNRTTGETVLHKASRMGYDETVYHCIQQGSDSNARDNAGWTPLHEACSRGHADVIKVLVKYNADVNAASTDGIRPIHDAADNGNIDSLRFLISYGADPFISTYSGRSCMECAKYSETKDYIKACIGDLYLNDERNSKISVDYENRWDFRCSSSFLDEDYKYSNDIFDNAPKQQSNTSVEVEWSETPHLPTYSLPVLKDGLVLGRKNYILLRDLQETLGKPRQSVIKMLKRTPIREVKWSEFSKEVSRSSFNTLCEPPAECSSEEAKIELVPLNWSVRGLLRIKCEHVTL